MITDLKIVYKLDKGRLNTKLDKELRSFITEKYGLEGLEWTGQGYDLEAKERDITFIKKEGE